MTGSSLKLCGRWLNFRQDSWILWKIGHGLTSEQCRWFVWFLKHWKMLYFGNQVERNKHTKRELSWIWKLFFHMSLWAIITFTSFTNTAPHARNTVVPFLLDGEKIVPLRQILPSSSNHLRIGNFQLALQKLVAMTKSTIYSSVPYHSYRSQTIKINKALFLFLMSSELLILTWGLLFPQLNGMNVSHLAIQLMLIQNSGPTRIYNHNLLITAQSWEWKVSRKLH